MKKAITLIVVMFLGYHLESIAATVESMRAGAAPSLWSDTEYAEPEDSKWHAEGGMVVDPNQWLLAEADITYTFHIPSPNFYLGMEDLEIEVYGKGGGSLTGVPTVKVGPDSVSLGTLSKNEQANSFPVSTSYLQVPENDAEDLSGYLLNVTLHFGSLDWYDIKYVKVRYTLNGMDQDDLLVYQILLDASWSLLKFDYVTDARDYDPILPYVNMLYSNIGNTKNAAKAFMAVMPGAGTVAGVVNPVAGAIVDGFGLPDLYWGLKGYFADVTDLFSFDNQTGSQRFDNQTWDTYGSMVSLANEWGNAIEGFGRIDSFDVDPLLPKLTSTISSIGSLHTRIEGAGTQYARFLNNSDDGLASCAARALALLSPMVRYNLETGAKQSTNYLEVLSSYLQGVHDSLPQPPGNPVISGYVRLESGAGFNGALVTADNDGGSDYTDQNGLYQITVPYDWSGTVSASKDTYIFSPTINWDNITADLQTSYVITGYQPHVSGYVYDDDGDPIIGVTVTADNGGGTAISSADGYYYIILPYGYEGGLAASHEGYSFNGYNITIYLGLDDVDFTGTPNPLTISGYILTPGGYPIDGVSVSANNGGGTDSSDSQGYYSVSVFYNWSGTVTLSSPPNTFSPPSQTYPSIVSSYENQNYQGQDYVPPSPTPMTWETAPSAISATSVTMVATPAVDEYSVEYYFEETSGNPGGTDSGWQTSSTYENDGLAPNMEYSYRVIARDKSPNQNTNLWSASVLVSTGGDYDQDEIPDWWEIQYFIDPSACNPTNNSDHDAHNNLEEYITGMDPNDSNSVFTVTSSMQSDQYLVEWPCFSNRYYNLYWSTNLFDGFTLLEEDIVFPQNSFTDMVYNTRIHSFYRVDVSLNASTRQIVAGYRDDYQSGTMPTGWRYMWNATASINDPANYALLESDGVEWDTDSSSPGQPDPAPGAHLQLNSNGGHPGNGDPDRYAIASYQVSQAGHYFITNSFLTLSNTNFGGSVDGVNLRIHVKNDAPVVDLVLQSMQTTNFNGYLGFIEPGTSIYVSIGENGNSTRDAFTMDFQIERTN